MPLVPLIPPPILRALTPARARHLEMTQLRTVSKGERIVFPLVLLFSVALLLPAAAPLVGML